MAKVLVLGAGGWGTAFSVMCCANGHEVTMWSPFEAEIETLRREGEHKKLLPGVKLPCELKLTSDISQAKNADVVVFAVPSSAVKQTAVRLKGIVKPTQLILNLAKGLEEESLELLCDVIEEETGCPAAILSGPSHAEEVSRGVPTAVVVASKSEENAMALQDLFMNPVFRIYVSPDVVGVETGGSFKNIIALAAGICDGLKLGDNTKAALITRGMAEIARLGVSLGASAQTFAGLAGIGDLIVTCTSVHSRNRRAGMYIGEGMTAKEAVEKVGMTVEGYKTTQAAYRLAQRQGIDMPIVTECYHVLFEDKDPKQAINDLMGRRKKHETEQTWNI